MSALFAKYLKTFYVSSELVAPCTIYYTAVQCLILQHTCRVQCQSYCDTSLTTATAEKPASHKCDVANGTRTRRALQPTSGNSDRALTQ